MCIIALKPENISISDQTIKNMWENNDDGAGFMYADRGKVRIVKGLMTLDSFMDAYRRVGDHRKIVMHFRIRTHGEISQELTHPFWIRQGILGMVHNGVISSVGHTGKANESDTSLYARNLSKRFVNPVKSLESSEVLEKIKSEIGYSKLVFLTNDNRHIIVNEKLGDWHDGCWFSNGSHKTNYTRWSYKNAWMAEDYSGYEGYKPYTASTGTYNRTAAFTPTAASESPLVVVPASDDAEWEALINRYEARYGSVRT